LLELPRSDIGGSVIVREYRVAGRGSVGDLPAEQASDQLDRNTRGAAALVEKRIELDNVG
jgi:hypothetical protein